MYFNVIEKESGTVIVGPYLLSREKLINLSEKADVKLCEKDLAILHESIREIGIYDTEVLTVDTEFNLREKFTTIEYNAVYGSFLKQKYSVSEWCEMCGITQAQHKHLRAGRTAPDALLSRQLANMCLCHSYVQELSASYLSTINIDGRSISTVNAEEFAKRSIKALRILKTSANVGLRYYWSQRTHIDVCSLYPTIRQCIENLRDEKVDHWLKSAEWLAMTEPQAKKVKGLTEEQILNTYEYLTLVDSKKELTDTQNQRIIELARILAVEVLSNKDGACFENVSLGEAIKEIHNAFPGADEDKVLEGTMELINGNPLDLDDGLDMPEIDLSF